MTARSTTTPILWCVPGTPIEADRIQTSFWTAEGRRLNAPSRPTIRTIAEALGVDPSTVSRSLRPDPNGRIPSSTIRRVQAMAEELGYSPNPWARSLRTKRTNAVGIVVPSLTDAPLARMLEGAQDRARETGHILIVVDSRDRPAEQDRLVKLLLERRVDGIILATARITDASVAAFSARRIPMVLLNRASGTIPVVRGDDELGGYIATRHLIEQGHERIGLIAGWPKVSTAFLRRQGYERAHKEAGLRVDRSLMIQSSFSPPGGYEAASQLLAGTRPPSALFAVNDPTAIGAMAAARDRGLAIPGELAVVGYNDIELAAMLAVPLSSVALPLNEMGRAAVDACIGAVKGEAQESRLFSPRLIPRASSAQVHHLTPGSLLGDFQTEETRA